MARRTSYLKFLYRSSNQHGVHSPFVYNLLTKGLYRKEPRYKGSKKSKVFSKRIVAYFRPNIIDVVGNVNKANLKAQIRPFGTYSDKADVIWIGYQCNWQFVSNDQLYHAMHNDSVLMIDKRKLNRQGKVFYKNLVLDPRFTVTIDFFFFALLFVRKEQLKEHFILRM